MKRLNNIDLALLIFALLFLVYCTPSEKKTIVDIGRPLAEKYCKACHQVPDPNNIPQHIWREILPKMGARLGMENTISEIKHARRLKPLDLFPGKPLLTREEWNTIQIYYLSLSPDSLHNPVTEIHHEHLSLFKRIPLNFSKVIPATSLIKFDPQRNSVWYGHALEYKIYRYQFNNDSLAEFRINGSPSHMELTGNGFNVLTMGIIHPNDFKDGNILSFDYNHIQDTLVRQLPRPVDAEYVDLNSDNQTDIISSGFGYLAGELAWYEKTDEGYAKHILYSQPGPVKTESRDFNGDGHIDILALIAQGDEGFHLFTGDGQGNFRSVKIISFPPSYGSTYFELVDFNEDGKPDILYANGDNGDYMPVMKPYHGVRIFLNTSQNGNVSFKEQWFYHMNGTFKSMAEDYDLDGDLDIACISYFPDYNRSPEESFVYLKNQGNFNFKPYTIEGSTAGKWLVMDKADYDNDGDTDLVLGSSLILTPQVPIKFEEKWHNNKVTLLLLENQTR